MMSKTIPFMIVAAASLGSAFAQTPPAAPTVKPQASGSSTIIDAKALSPEQRSAAILAQSSEPAFDEQTASRAGEAIRRYKEIAARGGWGALPSDARFTAGMDGALVTQLRQRLIVTGDLPPAETQGAYDDALIAVVKRFQTRNGLLATGMVGPLTLAALNVPVEKRIQQLEASLQRIGVLGFKFGERYVIVNIPAAFAEAIENDKVVRRYRVIVGKTDKPSPTVTSLISNVNVNPTWTVPSSITRKEISAHMRKDPGYLSRMHMQVLDAGDHPVDPASVDWSEGKTPDVTVRQEPGEWNALGRLRIDMPNSYAVYMHDTNQRHLFADDYRFDSHGCVRVDNVRDLAAWLLKDTPNWDRSQIDQAIASGQRQDVKLAKPVPVAWIYLTAWVSKDGVIQFRNDVYDQDAQLMEASAEVKDFFKQATDRVVR